MLCRHLQALPLAKFVLIEDSLEHRSNAFLQSLIFSHSKYGTVHYFSFEGVYRPPANCVAHDCVSNCCGWLSTPNSDFTRAIKEIGPKSIVIVDSLVHAVYQYNFNVIYRLVKDLMSNKDVLRIVAVFHSDLETDCLRYFQYLATFHMTLQPNVHRISYVYKKSRKAIAQTESYRIVKNEIVSEKIKILEPKKLAENLDPEELSTFRIGLREDERELRSKVKLPYLPKENQEDGEIFYEFDDNDDWDEEDPDDDLDI